MKIIDSHMHISTMLGFYMPEKMVLEAMDKYHIDYALISNCNAAEYGHDGRLLPKIFQKSQAACFKRAIKFARENEGRIGVLPWIKPTVETADEVLEQLIAANLDIVKGIKMHAYHSHMATDDDRMVPYVELAEKYDLPMMIHTGGSEEASPQRVYNMAKRYPKVLFIMAHMGLGSDNQEAIALMGEAENLIADTAWVPMESTIEIIRRYGSKRILFGTDSPIDGVDTYRYNKAGEPSLYVQYLNDLEPIIGTEAYADLMYRNAMRIFKINEIN